ncbi:hypothetical protein [Novipirellula sp.]|uniref:hypothetical protein n=1 Tax=Novipirellula sp. TaxID=2795430 RepID=UPI00356312C5
MPIQYIAVQPEGMTSGSPYPGIGGGQESVTSLMSANVDPFEIPSDVENSAATGITVRMMSLESSATRNRLPSAA